MKAWLLDSFRGLDAMHLADVPAPHPQAHEVVLDVGFAALNPADRYLAEGQYPAKPSLPHVLGRDGMGTIIEVGEGVEGHAVGERRTILRGEVGVSQRGTFAQRVVVPAQSLVAAPEGWTSEQSSAAALVYVTAFQALTQWGPLPPSVVLVTGASGGVGVAGVHLGSAMSHTVIGLSRDEAKHQPLIDQGAAACFSPTDSQWRKKLRSFLNGGRVNLAIDNIGGPLLPEVIDTLDDLGKVSVVGRLAGPVPQFNTATLFFRRLKLGGVMVGAYTSEESHAAWNQVVALMASGGRRPLIDSIFAFNQLPQAFERLAHGPLGKVLLRPD